MIVCRLKVRYNIASIVRRVVVFRFESDDEIGENTFCELLTAYLSYGGVLIADGGMLSKLLVVGLMYAYLTAGTVYIWEFILLLCYYKAEFEDAAESAIQKNIQLGYGGWS